MKWHWRTYSPWHSIYIFCTWQAVQRCMGAFDPLSRCTRCTVAERSWNDAGIHAWADVLDIYCNWECLERSQDSLLLGMSWTATRLRLGCMLRWRWESYILIEWAWCCAGGESHVCWVIRLHAGLEVKVIRAEWLGIGTLEVEQACEHTCIEFIWVP